MDKPVIGYTSGVFDLFHVGHLNILKRAKEPCDHLIVAVSTDELVEAYKHKRPVIPYADRVEIVKAIRYVDEVVPQISRNKLAAWEQYRFDKMFVGDDWKGSELFSQAEKAFEPLGVRVIYFPRTQGISSSALAHTVREAQIANSAFQRAADNL